MHLDIQAMFADQFDLSTLALATATTAPSSIPLGLPGTPPSAFQGPIGGPVIHDIGRGRRIPLFVQITSAVTSAGAATVQCDLVTADDGPLTVNKTVILSSAPIAKAALVAGYRFRMGVVPKGITQAFMGVQFTVGTAVATAGKVTAALALDDNDHADILG